MNKEINFRKVILISFFLFMTTFHVFFFFHIQGVNCPSNWLSPLSACDWSSAVFELLLWMVVLVLFILELYWDHYFKEFLVTCREFWPIFIFILLAVFSLAWSILFSITLYKIFVLLMSTLISIYIGRQLGVQQLLNVLIWFFSVISVTNLLFVLLFPKSGIMALDFYHQAWNGLFWHRNYLGCFMALGISIFLLKLFDWKNLSRIAKVVIPIMLVLTIFLLIKAKSATGIITALILAIFCFLTYVWIKNIKYIKSVHYYIAAGIIVIVVALALFHLDFLFGLLGRNTSLTGRVPMWEYLFQNVINKRLLLGYGYGAIWSLEGFRAQLGTILNWNFPVLIGDNGFIDIWLHLGLVGVLLLIILIGVGFVRAVKLIIKEKTVISILPLIVMVFVVVANISLSMILETETFVWAIAIASQVAIGSLLQKQSKTL